VTTAQTTQLEGRRDN